MSAHIKNLAAVAVLTVAAVASPTSALADGKPSFWVENESLDLGKVVAGQTASATFVFHNDSDAEVQIIRAAPS